MPGLSESIEVVSIVDRFLEHARIFHFRNGGDEEVYLSSADWMPRNLDRRIELLFPVESPEGRQKVLRALDAAFRDDVKARVLQSDGSYVRRPRRPGEAPFRSQIELFRDARRAVERARAASEPRARAPRLARGLRSVRAAVVPLPSLSAEERAAFEKGVAEFNAGLFFECHDTLEELWAGVRGPSRDFFQGLIQVAVGFYHLGNENPVGAERLFGRALRRLEPYPDRYGGVDLGGLRGVVEWWRRALAGPGPQEVAGRRPPPTLSPVPPGGDRPGALSPGRESRRAPASRPAGAAGAPRRRDGATTRGHWIRVHRPAMACRFEVTLGSEDARFVPAARAALDEVDALEAALTVFRDTSELARLNREAAAGPVEVSAGLMALLGRCAALHAATGGAFDPTSTPLSRAWGFLARQGREPSPEEIAAARARVGMERVVLDRRGRTVSFAGPGVELNLGSIGKGWALDQIAAGLQARGLRRRPRERRGQQLPRLGPGPVAAGPGAGARGLADLWLQGAALATSGAGEQHVEVEGAASAT